MKLTIVKGVTGLVGASGLGVGSYYTYQALKTPEVSNIKDALKKAKYVPFELDVNGWNSKFNEFKEGETNNVKFAAILNAKYPDLAVAKGKTIQNGGAKLKSWCEEVFDEKENTKHEHQNLDNAKLFCATAPTG